MPADRPKDTPKHETIASQKAPASPTAPINVEKGTVIINAVSPLRTSEAGGLATFSITLSTAPTHEVSIVFSSSSPSEGMVAPSMITFTHDNAQTPQVLTIKGVDDEIADGDQPYTVLSSATASSDPRFQGIDVPDLQVINSDDDMPGLLVTPSSGLMTSETGGQASFSVKLTTQPLRDCLLSLSSSNTNEGVLSVTQLLFTPTSWNTPQTVIVRGVDDAMADGAQDYRVRISRISSQDPRYDGMLAPDVSVINSDDDRASVIVEPISGLTTSEDGASTTFTIRLGTMPEAQVTFNLSSDKPSEGFPTTYSVSFTQDNWFRAQSITIKGVDDIISDGAQTYNIVIEPAQTVDSIYRGIDPPDVSVTNTDNDPKYYFWPNNIMPRYYPY